MIPQAMQIKNFLSYGSQLQTVNFEPYHMICLSGKNGHGKSALLDAMTWAIWGQARKTVLCVKPDQGLLRLGQTHMMVIFDFICNNQHYRIRREYTHTKGKQQTVLEFGVFDEHDKKCISLTDKTIRTTQEKIEKTIRLDFESFINSAFLRQGNANEFSKKSSKDRKEIFATILGLHQYELLRRLALNKIKNAQIKQQTLIAFQSKIAPELEKIESVRLNSADLATQALLCKKHEEALATEKELFVVARERLRVEQKKQEFYEFQLQQIEQDENKGQKVLQESRNLWRVLQRKKRSLPALSELEQKKSSLLLRMQEYQNQLQHMLELKEKDFQIKVKLNNLEHMHREACAKNKTVYVVRREQLLIKQQHLQEQMSTHEKMITEQELEYKKIVLLILDLEQKMSPIEPLKREIDIQEKQLEKRKNYYQQWMTQGNWCASELKNLISKKELTYGKDDPSCPLCEQSLTGSRRKFLQQKFGHHKKILEHKKQRLQIIVKKLKASLIEQHTLIMTLKKEHEHTVSSIQQLQDAVNKKEKISAQKADYEKQMHEIRMNLVYIQKEVEKEEKNRDDTAAINTLEQNAEYAACTLESVVIQEKLKHNEYNEQQHKAVIKALDEVEDNKLLYQQLLRDLAQKKDCYKDVIVACQHLRQLRHRKNACKKELFDPSILILREKELAQQEEHWEKKCSLVRQKKEEIIIQQAQLQSEEKKLLELEQEYHQFGVQIKELSCTVEDYQTIAQATGKDGIQALLIEDAIPEIEQEANNLLKRLTNNQEQIFIESLRDLKSGGTKETLDIKISDAAGIRPYELFSGGEAFRIDFALRIAISKLLARRAGTALQTLIIDEGFGSQDEEGLTHIMDALHKIRDDFSKIIIVSHLSVMKDQFPIHFVVEKGPQGSLITVVEND